jgi:hypothetical protein
VIERGLTNRLTGAGARSAEGTDTGHKNAEGMASVGVRVEPIVRLWREEMEERFKWLTRAMNLKVPHDVTRYDEFLLRLLAECNVQRYQ